MASEKSTDEAGSRYNKGTIRGDLRYLGVSQDVRRHRLISISYISHGRCHCSVLDSQLPRSGLLYRKRANTQCSCMRLALRASDTTLRLFWSVAREQSPRRITPPLL